MFDFAGGEPAFLELAAAHHERCLQDPVLNHPFSHPGHPQHVERLASYWAEVFGGPPRYSESCGGHSGMLEIHAGTDGEDELGTRFVECFVRAADDADLPDDAEFRGELRAYMEWAVKDVLSHSPRGSVVRPGRAIPRWSWGGLEPTPASS
jgi:hemoglobin